LFEELGLDTTPCVGTRAMADAARAGDTDAVICDYDLLATVRLSEWESDPALANVPVIAVSLTRHPGEAHLQDVNGITGFFYLPSLDRDDAQHVLAGIRRRPGINPPDVLSWPRTTSAAHLG
jgi:hypothetical protein